MSGQRVALVAIGAFLLGMGMASVYLNDRNNNVSGDKIANTCVKHPETVIWVGGTSIDCKGVNK